MTLKLKPFTREQLADLIEAGKRFSIQKRQDKTFWVRVAAEFSQEEFEACQVITGRLGISRSSSVFDFIEANIETLSGKSIHLTTNEGMKEAQANIKVKAGSTSIQVSSKNILGTVTRFRIKTVDGRREAHAEVKPWPTVDLTQYMGKEVATLIFTHGKQSGRLTASDIHSLAGLYLEPDYNLDVMYELETSLRSIAMGKHEGEPQNGQQ